MKQLQLLLLITIIACTFVSCSKDDNNLIDENATVLGTWNMSDIDISGTRTFIYPDSTLIYNVSGSGLNLAVSSTFAEPNIYTTDGDWELEYVYSREGEADVTETEDYSGGLFGGSTWSRVGNQLIFQSFEDSLTTNLIQLDDETLKTSITLDNDNFDVDEDEAVDITFVFTFLKQ